MREMLGTQREPVEWGGLAPQELKGLLDPASLPALPNLQRLVRPAQSHVVRRIGEEADTAMPRESLWAEVEALYQTGLHPAIALNVRHRGEVILDRTIGHVRHEPGEAPGAVATPDTRFSLFSGSKILTSTLVHALHEDGLLSIDDTVASYLPEFARHGKGGICIRHLLQHTAGIPNMPDGVDIESMLPTGRMDMEPLYDLRPLSAPGDKVAYHPLTSWFLVERIVEQVTGTDLRTAAEARILHPLGLHSMSYGAPEAHRHEVARHAVTGPPTPAPVARIFERTIGVDLDQAIRLTNSEDFLTHVLPSANVVSTPSDATGFMQMLLNGGELNGRRVLREETVARMVGEVTRPRIDGTFGFPIRYGLGVMMGGMRFSLFGLNTRGAFGHLGLSNVVVYADPARELSVAFLNTGKPLLAPGMLRWYWVMQRIAMAVPRNMPRGG